MNTVWQKTFRLAAAGLLLLLASCFEETLLTTDRLVILFTGDTVGEIEPCG